MAKLGEAFVEIKAKQDKLVAGLKDAQNRVIKAATSMQRRFDRINMKRANAALGRFTQGIFSMKTALAGAGIGLLVRDVIKTGMEFEHTMTKVKAVSGANEAQFRSMTKVVKHLGETTEWTASQAAGGMAFLSMAGFKAADSIKALPGVLDLATAGDIELARAADLVTNALTAMRLEVEDLGRVSDVFIQTITTANTNMEMMAESFKYAAPSAAAFGYEIEDLSALIGLLGNAGIQGCYDDQTEVLTEDGWKDWSQVLMSDKFATLNPDTNELEWQSPIRLIRYRHTGKMYCVQNRGIDLCVTPDHRMWVKQRGKDKKFEILTAKEVDGKTVRYQAGGIDWVGNDCEHHILEGFKQGRGSWVKDISAIEIDAETWAAFLGWYLSEGSSDYYKGCYRIRITQMPGPIRDKMRKVLGLLPFKVHEDKNGFTILNEQLWRAVNHLGKSYEKFIPDYAKDWSPRLLRILLDSLIEGDGDENGEYYTSSVALRDDIMEIALKLGHATKYVERTRERNGLIRGRGIKTRHPQWKVYIRTKQLYPWFAPPEYNGKHGDRLDGSKFPVFEGWIDYDGEVFCAEVPNHLLIVRRNGKALVSGNSMAGTQLAFSFQQVEKAFKFYGESAKRADGSSKDLFDAIELLEDKSASATDTMKIFGMRGGRAILALMGMGTEAINKYRETIREAEGATERIAKTFRETFKGAIKELQSAIEGVKIEAFEGEVRDLERAIRDLTEWVRENKESLVELAAATIDVGIGFIRATTAVGNFFTKIGTGLAVTAAMVAGYKIEEELYPAGYKNWEEARTAVSLYTKSLEQLEEKLKKLSKPVTPLPGMFQAPFNPSEQEKILNRQLYDKLKKQIGEVTTSLNIAKQAMRGFASEMSVSHIVGRELVGTLIDTSKVLDGVIGEPAKKLKMDFSGLKASMKPIMDDLNRMWIATAFTWDDSKDKLEDYTKLMGTDFLKALGKASDFTHKLKKEQTGFFTGVKKGLEETINQWTDWTTIGTNLTTEMLYSLQGFFDTMLFSFLKGEYVSLEEIWENLLDNMLRAFVNMLSQMAAAWES